MKIYTLNCPITNTPKYIGITKNSLFKRLSQHLVETRNNKRKSWIKSLKNKGLLPIIELLDEVDDAIWEDEEKFYISYFRYLGFNLVNMTEGGDRVEMTKEIRDKISKRLTGIKRSESTKERIRLAHSEGRIGTTGKKFSEKHKEKISLALLNKIVSDETKKKLSIVNNKNKRKLGKYSIEGELIETFESISECCKKYNYSKGNIIKVCKCKIRKDGTKCKTAYGFIWKYQ